VPSRSISVNVSSQINEVPENFESNPRGPDALQSNWPALRKPFRLVHLRGMLKKQLLCTFSVRHLLPSTDQPVSLLR
jgi:hypothetical protein